MNLYQLVYHILSNYNDGFGIQHVSEVVQSTTAFVSASTEANAITALTATLTLPDNGYLEVQSVETLATGIISGS